MPVIPIRERHIFEAILAVPESVAARWLADRFQPHARLTTVAQVLGAWPPDEGFTVALARRRLGLPDSQPSNGNGAATSRKGIQANRDAVQLRHGDLLSDGECDLLVLPCSSAGTASGWVIEIAGLLGLPGPTILDHGTLGEVHRTELPSGAVDRRAFVYAASVDERNRSSADAIRRIGSALGQLTGFRRIGTPLLGAGLSQGGKERVPAVEAFEALREGFLAVSDPRADLVVLIPDADRFAQLEAAMRARSPGDATPRAASVISGFRSDAIGDKDLLDIEDEVNALCSIIAATDVKPPLSIGLFGDWGSGKSFFIDKMKRRLGDIGKAARAAELRKESPRYCSHITQLEFNAWRYIDTDLWASLAEGIIDGLARSLEKSKDATIEQRARLLAAASSSRDVLAQAEQRRQKARESVEAQEQRLVKLVAEANAPQPSGAVIEQAARRLAVAKTSELRSGLDKVAKELGARAETSEARAGLLDLQGTFRNVKAIWLCFQSQPGRTRLLRLLLPLAAFAVATAVTAALNYGLAWAVDTGTLLISAAAAAAPLFKRARSATAEIARLANDYRAQIDEEREAQRKEAEAQRDRTRKELAEAEAHVRKAKEDLASLEDQLDALRADRMMAEFIRKRQASDDYRKHFGVIARARDDFEQLSTLLIKAREERSTSDRPSLPRIDRIVLYIDDLDRCNEEQVVKVLQAVHLLLAFELFVVIVAVDSRWLLHSLQQHSKVFESDSAQMVGIPSGEEGHWQSTPLNYLEKIFQIPFSLNPMNHVGFGKLIDSLIKPLAAESSSPHAGAVTPGQKTSTPVTPRSAEDQRAAEKQAVPVSVDTTAQGPDVDPATPTPRRTQDGNGANLDERSRAREVPAQAPEIDVRPSHLEIGEPAQAFMKLLHAFVPSPRAAKRFVNVFRLLLAGVPADNLTQFNGTMYTGEHKAVLLLLAVMIGFPAQAAEVMHNLVEQPVTDDWWTWWEAFLGGKRRVSAEGSSARRRWEDVAEHLDALKSRLAREEMRLPSCDVFRFWAPRVARFSFASGRLGVVPEPARLQVGHEAGTSPARALPRDSTPAAPSATTHA